MRNYETAPQLACDIGKIPLPTAVASDSDEVCALTGQQIPAGTVALVPWKAAITFRDQYDIVDRSSCYVAQETAAILAKPYMQKYSKSVISPDGWFRFASTNDVAWFLLHPPTPPFVMVFGLAQMEHLLWRTPLSLSRDLFVVRLGQRLLRINRPRVLEVLSLRDSCTQAVNAWLETQGKKPIHVPFLAISRELTTASTGQLHPAVYQAAEAGGVEAAEFIDRFLSLSSGDLWALGRIHASRSLELSQPEPLDFSN